MHWSLSTKPKCSKYAATHCWLNDDHMMNASHHKTNGKPHKWLFFSLGALVSLGTESPISSLILLPTRVVGSVPWRKPPGHPGKPQVPGYQGKQIHMTCPIGWKQNICFTVASNSARKPECTMICGLMFSLHCAHLHSSRPVVNVVSKQPSWQYPRHPEECLNRNLVQRNTYLFGHGNHSTATWETASTARTTNLYTNHASRNLGILCRFHINNQDG